MIEHPIRPRLRSGRRFVLVLGAVCLTFGLFGSVEQHAAVAAIHAATKPSANLRTPEFRPPGSRTPPLKPATPKLPSLRGVKPELIASCMRKSHLIRVARSASYLWFGWDRRVDDFVYAQLYVTAKSAKAEARVLSKLETGLAGRLVVKQPIAPYRGSPVSQIVRCLHGKMISKPPKPGKPFRF